jgi:HAD superfamily hydrolase (TIGR01509 family)
MRSKTKFVLLDAGGVILDETEHEAIRAEVIVETLATVIPGYNADSYCRDIDEAVASYCPNTYQYVFWKCLKPDKDTHERLYSKQLELWRKRRPPLKLMEGIEDEIWLLAKRFKIAMAGQYGGEILDLLEHASILNCFASRITQDDFPITKPDPRYYKMIADALGVSPECCIMVGDRIDKDVIPAKQVGMKTVLVRGGLHAKQQPRTPAELPDIEICGVKGLADRIESFGCGNLAGDS